MYPEISARLNAGHVPRSIRQKVRTSRTRNGTSTVPLAERADPISNRVDIWKHFPTIDVSTTPPMNKLHSKKPKKSGGLATFGIGKEWQRVKRVLFNTYEDIEDRKMSNEGMILGLASTILKCAPGMLMV